MTKSVYEGVSPPLEKFQNFVTEQTGQNFTNYAELHAWSVRDVECFWTLWWRFGSFIGEGEPQHIVQGITGRFFQGVKLNFAENLLAGDPQRIAMVCEDERGARSEMTYCELKDRVASVQNILKKRGLKYGDRVVGYLPNTPEAVIAMLGVLSLGGVWACCGWELGASLVQSRFAIIQPKFLILTGSKEGRAEEAALLQHKEAIGVQDVLCMGYMGQESADPFEGALVVPSVTVGYEISFEKFDFNTPGYIVFSSGTTGKPKCMVHSVGGALVQHKKEHFLHCSITSKDAVLFYTTVSWMMWQWLVGSLALGATVLLYQGSALAKGGRNLLAYAAKEKATVFGASASYYDLITKRMRQVEGLSIRCALSTGSVLTKSTSEKIEKIFQCDAVYSISGGTDILSCFVLGNPLSEGVHGQIHGAGLGMDVGIFDEKGHRVFNEKGELVCQKAFPIMPLYFWDDDDGLRYKDAYMRKFEGVWAQGDFALEDETGRFVIYGRSDTVLNPGGVRIGTAEVYAILHKLPYISDSLMTTVSKKRERLILLVAINDEEGLSQARAQEIRTVLESEGSRSFVPTWIQQVAAVPRTHNGKLAEKAVLEMLRGEKIDRSGLAKPEVLNTLEKELQHLID